MNIDDVALGALLHDIGKIYIRAYREEWGKLIDQKNQQLYENYPEVRTAKHTIYGYEMVENINLNDFVKQSILHHHTKNPPNQLISIISIADRLASAERVDYEKQNSERSYNLVSVFSEINISENKNNKTPKYKPVFSIRDFVSQDQYLFEKISQDQRKYYQKISGELLDNLRSLSEDSIEDIICLYREYTSNIPSAFYYSKPTISLYAHSLSTAAIATSIFAQFQEQILNNDFKFIQNLYNQLNGKEENTQILGLIKADISGIQNFIFNTPYDKALKQLKGKSFYLELLLELLVKYIIKQENLTQANILMIGGGHFYLLTPAKTIDKVNDYQKFIDHLLYSAHKNNLSIILTGMKMNFNNIKHFSKSLQEINRIHEGNKNRKMRTLVFEKPDFFDPHKPAINHCPYCDKELIQEECDLCNSFAELASKLSRNNYIIIHQTNIKNYQNITNNITNISQVFEALGFKIDFSLTKNGNSYKIKEKYKGSFEKYITIANYIPQTNNTDENEGPYRIKEISEIAQLSKGIKRWGILKGDVDSLGKVFLTIADPKEPSSLSKIITLSYEIKTFFSIVVEKLVENEFPNCLIVYSGGDDFLIIGPYNELYELSFTINNEFRKWADGNLTLTMAFVIAVDEKHPVYRVAAQADYYLDISKDEGKNAINIMGKTIKWSELDLFRKIVEKIENIIEQKKGSKSIINYLIQSSYYLDYKIVPSWRLFYKLHNYKQRYKDTQQDVDDLQDLIYKKQGNKIYENLFQAAKFVDYLTR